MIQASNIEASKGTHTQAFPLPSAPVVPGDVCAHSPTACSSSSSTSHPHEKFHDLQQQNFTALIAYQITRRVCLALQVIGGVGQEGRVARRGSEGREVAAAATIKGGSIADDVIADEVALIKHTVGLQLKEAQHDLAVFEASSSPLHASLPSSSLSSSSPPASDATSAALAKTLGRLDLLLSQLERLGREGGGKEGGTDSTTRCGSSSNNNNVDGSSSNGNNGSSSIRREAPPVSSGRSFSPTASSPVEKGMAEGKEEGKEEKTLDEGCETSSPATTTDTTSSAVFSSGRRGPRQGQGEVMDHDPYCLHLPCGAVLPASKTATATATAAVVTAAVVTAATAATAAAAVASTSPVSSLSSSSFRPSSFSSSSSSSSSSRSSSSSYSSSRPSSSSSISSISSSSSSSSSSPPFPLRLLLVIKDAKRALRLSHAAQETDDKDGFRVEVVRSALQALSRLSVQHYDVVIMEADFPMVDGVAAVRRLRRFEGWLESLRRSDAALPPALGVKQEEGEASAKPPSFVVLVENAVDRRSDGSEGGREGGQGVHSFERRAWRAGADLVVRNFEDVCLTNIRSIVVNAAAAAAAARDKREEKKEREEEKVQAETGLRMDRNGAVVIGMRVTETMIRGREAEEEVQQQQQEDQKTKEEERRENKSEGDMKEEDLLEWEGRRYGGEGGREGPSMALTVTALGDLETQASETCRLENGINTIIPGSSSSNYCQRQQQKQQEQQEQEQEQEQQQINLPTAPAVATATAMAAGPTSSFPTVPSNLPIASGAATLTGGVYGGGGGPAWSLEGGIARSVSSLTFSTASGINSSSSSSSSRGGGKDGTSLYSFIPPSVFSTAALGTGGGRGGALARKRTFIKREEEEQQEQQEQQQHPKFSPPRHSSSFSTVPSSASFSSSSHSIILNKARRACAYCHNKKVSCTCTRPCRRCVDMNIECVEYEPRPRNASWNRRKRAGSMASVDSEGVESIKFPGSPTGRHPQSRQKPGEKSAKTNNGVSPSSPTAAAAAAATAAARAVETQQYSSAPACSSSPDMKAAMDRIPSSSSSSSLVSFLSSFFPADDSLPPTATAPSCSSPPTPPGLVSTPASVGKGLLKAGGKTGRKKRSVFEAAATCTEKAWKKQHFHQNPQENDEERQQQQQHHHHQHRQQQPQEKVSSPYHHATAASSAVTRPQAAAAAATPGLTASLLSSRTLLPSGAVEGRGGGLSFDCPPSYRPSVSVALRQQQEKVVRLMREAGREGGREGGVGGTGPRFPMPAHLQQSITSMDPAVLRMCEGGRGGGREGGKDGGGEDAEERAGAGGLEVGGEGGREGEGEGVAYLLGEYDVNRFFV
ncbi:zn-c6 fungal-type dna-binding domain partial [Nannochloropsis oceanica]